MKVNGFEIQKPVNDASAMPYITMLTLISIEEKLDKLLEGLATAPLVLENDVVVEQDSVIDLNTLSLDELKEIANQEDIKYAKNITKKTLIKKLEG